MKGNDCVKELMAWLEESLLEEYLPSPCPACVSPVLAPFLWRYYSASPSLIEEVLEPFLPPGWEGRSVTTTAQDGKDETRIWFAADWLARVSTPAWLDRAGLTRDANALRKTAPIHDRASAQKIQPRLAAARKAITKATSRDITIGEAISTAIRDDVTEVIDHAICGAVNAAMIAVAKEAPGDVREIVAVGKTNTLAVWNAARVAVRVATKAAVSGDPADTIGNAIKDTVNASAWIAAGDALLFSGPGAIQDSIRPAMTDALHFAVGSVAVKHLMPTAVSLEESALHLLQRLIVGE